MTYAFKKAKGEWKRGQEKGGRGWKQRGRKGTKKLQSNVGGLYLKKIYFYFIYEYLPACMYVHHVYAWYSRMPEEGIRYPWNWSYRWLWATKWVLWMNLGHLSQLSRPGVFLPYPWWDCVWLSSCRQFKACEFIWSKNEHVVCVKWALTWTMTRECSFLAVGRQWGLMLEGYQRALCFRHVKFHLKV